MGTYLLVLRSVYVPARAARIAFVSAGGGGGGGGGAALGNAIPGAAQATKAKGNIDVVKRIFCAVALYLESKCRFIEIKSDL